MFIGTNYPHIIYQFIAEFPGYKPPCVGEFQTPSCFLDTSSDHGIIRLELRYLERVGEPTKFKIDLDFRDNPIPGAKRRWEILRGEPIDPGVLCG